MKKKVQREWIVPSKALYLLMKQFHMLRRDDGGDGALPLHSLVAHNLSKYRTRNINNRGYYYFFTLS